MTVASRRGLAAALGCAAVALAACGGASSTSSTPSPATTSTIRPTSTEVASPSATATAFATEVATPTPSLERVVVTLRVAGSETYHVLLTDPADVAIARQLLAGEEVPGIPNGEIVRDGDGGVNAGWSWHIDPETFEWAEVTTEVCDGLPSFVEDGTLTGPRFCPWSATVVEVQPAG